MKRDKRLDEIADDALSEFDNPVIKARLMEEVAKLKKPKKTIYPSRFLRFTGLAVAVICIAVCALFLTSPSFFPSDSSRPSESIKKEYGLKDMETTTTDLADLNANLKNVSCKQMDGEAFLIRKYRDVKYNETLYFSLQYMTEAAEKIEVHFVTNKDYPFTFDHKYNGKETYIGDYLLEYSENFKEDDGLYDCQAYGKMVTGDETVYFTFTSMEFEQTSRFIEIVKNLITVK